jgi:CHAT domain-containing protein
VYGNVLRRRRSCRSPWVVWTITALLAAWHLLTHAAPVSDPDWCSGQGRLRHQYIASAALTQLAFEEANRGRNEAALSALCAAFVRNDVQRQDQGNIANYAGTILFRGPGNLDLAMSAFRDAIALSDAGSHPSEAATVHSNLSNAFLRKNLYSDAQRELDTAIRLARTIGDADQRFASLASFSIKQGLLAEALAELDLAGERYEEAHQLAKRVSAQASENIRFSATQTRNEAIHNLAVLQSSRGRYGDAIKGLLGLRELARADGSAVTEYWATFSLMLAYQELGRHEEALALAPALDELHRMSPDTGLRASALAARGRSLFIQGQFNAAMAQLTEAAEYFGSQRMVSEMAQALNAMGIIAMYQGRPAVSRRAFEDALKGRRIIDDRIGEGITLGALGGLAWRLDNTDVAMKYFEKATEVLEMTPAPTIYAHALGSLGVALQGVGKPQQARLPLERSVDLLWRYRAVRQSSLLGTNENDRVRPIYDALIRNYLADGQDVKALGVAEQVRAAGVRSGMTGQPNTKILAAGEQETATLGNARDKAFRAMRAQQTQPGIAAEQAAAAALQELEEAMARFELSSPASERGEIALPALVENLQRALGPSRALLVYYRAEDGWLVFVVTEKAVNAVELDVRDERLSSLVNSFREFSWDEGGVPPELKSLYSALITPALASIGDRDLIVVPSAKLSQMPFAALYDGRSYLAETRSVSYALGIGHALQMLSDGQPARRAQATRGAFLAATAAVSMAPLAYADAEAKEGSERLPGSTFVSNAGLKDYFAQAPSATVIHIAAHAVADARNPLLSRILLMPKGQEDGHLSVSDVRRVRLSGKPLVVLSACESGLGKVYSDESVQALSGAFLQAGADAVISSLWLVDDASTSLLMSDFYEAFTRGVPTSLALKGAIQRAMKRNPHPFYWAAFTYLGPL